jgi:hypothetical protein
MFAHRDADSIYPDLIELHKNDLNIWYDEGISAGSSWRAKIATAIKGASKLVFFISEASLNSTHCLREIDYALNNDINIIPVYLDDSKLPGELELVLNRVHALFRESDSMYLGHLLAALQGTGSLDSLRRLTKKKRPVIWLAVGVIGVSLLFAVFLTQRDSLFDNGSIASSTVASPSAFIPYLSGLELLERWDKDENLDLAIDLFSEASELDPTFALAFARLAEALRIRFALSGNENWLDEAEGAIVEAIRLNADLTPVQVTLGRIQSARGNMDLAFAAFERAMSIDPNDAAANLAIGSMYVRLGRVEDAQASFQRILAVQQSQLLSQLMDL